MELRVLFSARFMHCGLACLFPSIPHHQPLLLEPILLYSQALQFFQACQDQPGLPALPRTLESMPYDDAFFKSIACNYSHELPVDVLACLPGAPWAPKASMPLLFDETNVTGPGWDHVFVDRVPGFNEGVHASSLALWVLLAFMAPM